VLTVSCGLHRAINRILFIEEKSNMVNEYQQQLRLRLEAMPFSPQPMPWKLVGGSSIGGLTEVGFADISDDLLVLSSQGRGLFDCVTGELIARDNEKMFPNSDESGMTAPGIGKHSSKVFQLAGLQGGGLVRGTKDGWGLHVIQLPWPIHVVFLTSNYAEVTDSSGNVTKLCSDEPCEYRAAGFSPTGRSFVVATSGELMFYARQDD